MTKQTSLQEGWKKYFNEWVEQGGRTEEMQYGVINFMTGKGQHFIQSEVSKAKVEGNDEVLAFLRGKADLTQGVDREVAERFLKEAEHLFPTLNEDTEGGNE